MSNNESTTKAVSDDLDALVSRWLTLPDVAEQLGVNVSRVRQLIREGNLVAVPRGERQTQQVPADFLDGDRVVKGLTGTLTVLHDAGYGPVEAVRWLFTADEVLTGTPMEALADNRGRQVRRQAQTLGF